MKIKFFADRILYSLLFVAAFSVNVNAQVDRAHTLKIYNWADYMDLDLIPEFEKWYEEQTGEKVKILYETFEINENMLTEIELGHEDYDVVCPSEYIVENMLRKNLLQKIPHLWSEELNYLNNVSPFCTEIFQQVSPDSNIQVKDYAIPYLWGTLGFVYNKKLVPEEDVESWATLFNPKYEKKILMKDAVRDIYCVLLPYARYDELQKGQVNRDELSREISDENIAKVEALMKKAKPQIAGWEVDFGKERMSQGKALISVAWSGDAQWAKEEQEEGVELGYKIPKEGGEVWFDAWVIPVYAKNVKAAAYFINYMCKVENAVRNAESFGYVSAVGTPEMLTLLEDSTKYPEPVNVSYFFGEGADSAHVNPICFPDGDEVANSCTLHDYGEKNEALLEMWNRVKGSNLNTSMIAFLGVGAAVILAIVCFYQMKKVRRRKHRKTMDF